LTFWLIGGVNLSEKKVDRRRYLKYAATAIVAAGVAGGAVYYGSRIPAAPKVTTIGYCSPWLLDIGQVAIKWGAEEGARKHNWKYVTMVADGDVTKQISQMEDLITMRVNAIELCPVDSTAIVPGVEAANKAGIPVFCIDRTAFGGKIVLTVESDNYLAGRQCGEALVKLLEKKYGKPKGFVMEMQGALGTDVARLRGAGFDDVITKYPDIELKQVPCEWDPATANRAVTDTWTARKQIDGIYWHSDYTGKGVISALEALGIKKPIDDPDHIFLVGIDATPDMLKEIREGYYDCDVSQPLTDFGVVAANFIERYLNGEKLTAGMRIEEPDALWSPAVVKEGKYGLEAFLTTTPVTKENVDDARLWGNWAAKILK
jgi:ABC-type sugar transport system substrate-binding protein